MSTGQDFAYLAHHPRYFLTGGDLFFLVERYIFCVHRYFFIRESPFFREALAGVGPEPPGPKGTSESNAFVLNGVRSEDFERFLWIFYNPQYSLYNTSLNDWIVILELAQLWYFDEVKDLVVRELEKQDISDIERIVLYHKCDIDRSILIPRYSALCARQQPLSHQEGLRLGIEVALTIARARECARGKSVDGGIRNTVPANLGEQEMTSLIMKVFRIAPQLEKSKEGAVATAGKKKGKISPGDH